MSTYVDSIDAADGVRLTVSQVKRICQAHSLDNADTQGVLRDCELAADGTFDAQEVLYAMGY